MAQIIFEPQDTLFFRDGRPFNQGEGTAATIISHFPPSPQTMVGAVRAAWAREMGWPGMGRWQDDLRKKLGGDEEELTTISFGGPLILVNNEPYYPSPASLIGKVDSKGVKLDRLTMLSPSHKSYNCDLGPAISLPVPGKNDNVEGCKLLQGWWLNKTGMTALLAGNPPAAEDLIHRDKLYAYETRTGIQLNMDSRTTEEGALYTTGHIRLKEHVFLALSVDSPPSEIKFTEGLRTVLGGESRSATITLYQQETAQPDCPELHQGNGQIRYTVVVRSPMCLEYSLGADWPACPFPGQLVSACLYRAERWGGWDTISRSPLALQPHIAPGSVFFMEAEERYLTDIKKLHGRTVGKRSTWGFGQVVIGRWT